MRPIRLIIFIALISACLISCTHPTSSKKDISSFTVYNFER